MLSELKYFESNSNLSIVIQLSDLIYGTSKTRFFSKIFKSFGQEFYKDWDLIDSIFTFY